MSGNYSGVTRRIGPGETECGRAPIGLAETPHSVEHSRYVVIGPRVKVDNWCLSKFGRIDPDNVAKAHTVMGIEEVRADGRWQGAAIVLVPGWSREGLATEALAWVLAGIDGMGA